MKFRIFTPKFHERLVKARSALVRRTLEKSPRRPVNNARSGLVRRTLEKSPRRLVNNARSGLVRRTREK